MDAPLNQRGMTLVEVMVAAAILALVMVAVMVVAGHSQRSEARLLNTTHAYWVANNIDAEIRAGLHGKPSQTGGFQGRMSMGHQSWYWSAQAQNQSEQVIGLLISVHDSENNPAMVTLLTAVWNPA